MTSINNPWEIKSLMFSELENIHTKFILAVKTRNGAEFNYIIKRMLALRYEFYFLVLKTTFYSPALLARTILFHHSKIKIIPSHFLRKKKMTKKGRLFII